MDHHFKRATNKLLIELFGLEQFVFLTGIILVDRLPAPAPQFPALFYCHYNRLDCIGHLHKVEVRTVQQLVKSSPGTLGKFFLVISEKNFNKKHTASFVLFVRHPLSQNL
jgi:hypothetical protein